MMDDFLFSNVYKCVIRHLSCFFFFNLHSIIMESLKGHCDGKKKKLCLHSFEKLCVHNFCK